MFHFDYKRPMLLLHIPALMYGRQYVGTLCCVILELLAELGSVLYTCIHLVHVAACTQYPRFSWMFTILLLTVRQWLHEYFRLMMKVLCCSISQCI